jgi:putative spermidine/putrescine transport system ATP-binding protein
MPMVVVDNLTKSYEGRRVLDGLSLSLERGEIAAVMGRSGSGKTTLLLCMLGFTPVDGGSISVDGADIAMLPVRDRRLAYMPQDYGLFPHLDVAGNIGFGLAVRRIGEDVRRKKIGELLRAVELPDAYASKRPDEISGGEKQRVALARALAIEPRCFLLDEPLSAIDAETKAKVAAQLRSIIKKTGIPAIIITHDADEAALLGDSTFLLESGRLTRR